MRGIGSVLGLLVVALIAGLFYKFYFAQGSSAGTTTPAQTIDIVGVKNDLLSIGQAERVYQAEHSSYATIDQLVSSGDLSMQKSGRDGYTYSAEASSNSFRVIATCPATTTPGCSNYAVDETMEVRSIP